MDTSKDTCRPPPSSLIEPIEKKALALTCLWSLPSVVYHPSVYHTANSASVKPYTGKNRSGEKELDERANWKTCRRSLIGRFMIVWARTVYLSQVGYVIRFCSIRLLILY